MSTLLRKERLTEGIKHCPWCREESPKMRRLFYTKTEDMDVIGCDNCGARGPMGSDKGAALDLWNNQKGKDDETKE